MFNPTKQYPFSTFTVLSFQGGGKYLLSLRGSDVIEATGEDVALLMEWEMTNTTSITQRFGANIETMMTDVIDNNGTGFSLRQGGTIDGVYVYPVTYTGETYYFYVRRSQGLAFQNEVYVSRQDPRQQSERDVRMSTFGVLPGDWREEGAPSMAEFPLASLRQGQLEGTLEIILNRLTGKVYVVTDSETDKEVTVAEHLMFDIANELDARSQ